MVKCPRCGYDNPSTAVYCDNCAYRLVGSGGNSSKSANGWNVGIAKKIVIVLGIIIIALLLFSLVYNNTQPSHNETLNVITDDGSHKTSSYPYVAVIDYNGNWYAEMGNPNFLVKKSESGPKNFTLDCASWDRIAIDAYKYGGEGELKVQLLRNGDVVAENSTTNGSERVVINYNY